MQWLKPGGRLGIVLPDGILGNPAAEYIRWWILRHTWVLASVDLQYEPSRLVELAAIAVAGLGLYYGGGHEMRDVALRGSGADYLVDESNDLWRWPGGLVDVTLRSPGSNAGSA